MLEVVFGNSTEGGLAVAQRCGGGVGGTRQDIVCFTDDLSMGDISGDCLSQSRRKAQEPFCALFPAEADRIFGCVQEGREQLDRLVKRASAGETVRIWYSEQPMEFCGLCWLLSQLKARMTKLPQIRLIRLPNSMESGNTSRRYMGWGSVPPEEFHQFLPLERKAIPAFIKAAVAQWRQLQEENAPLRAVINGTLQSVPEDFYDCFLTRALSEAEHEFREAELIGAVLKNNQLGIGDLWIAARIEAMVKQGRLLPLTQPKPGEAIYRRTLQKNFES